MRPVFAGNLEYDTRQSELERLFSKYGRIERVDMKSGKFLCFSLMLSNYFKDTCFAVFVVEVEVFLVFFALLSLTILAQP